MTFIDLFAGVGGFHLGMEQAGHECVGYVEIDKFARKSYEAIFDVKGKWTEHDITKVRAGDIPRADCWCFGFPCQDISIAGKQRGITDGKRSSLFFTVTGLIGNLEKEDKPSILFIENVKNLLSINRGFDFAVLLIELDKIGYNCEWQVLNSKDFGVPQNRERVFIIGHLRGRSTQKVFPVGGANKTALKQIVGGSQGERVYEIDGLSCTLSSQGGGGGAKTGLYLFTKRNEKINIRNHSTCIDANYGRGLGCHQERTGVLQIPRGNNKGGIHDIAPALTGNFYQENNFLYNEAKIRRLTPKECWRLQGFPNWAYERAAAVCSDNQLYKQAGNSVTVNVIYEIAKKLKLKVVELP